MTPPETAQDFPDPAARVANDAGRAPVLLLCDHATNAMPPAFANLGLQAPELDAHVAYDPGAAALTERLADKLDAAQVQCGYSRLLIDVNRDPSVRDSIVVENDGIRVPANATLPEADRAARVKNIYEPYHAAIDGVLDTRLRAQGAQLVVAVHSFAPRVQGVDRPWDIGVIFNEDRRLARELVGNFVEVEERPRLTVGLNEPYSPDDRVYHTLARHAEARGLPCAMIEVRNDEIATPGDQDRWAERLAGALTRSLSALAP
ncbi:Predicted N-formylglutamate amidohydrolase [Limimonas halophila]|uniref:Predicted N-formylglutamate amidohydrolase n=1 Tax=Limimonas halophila TaxID=1082479 RepID=A0A1G7TVU8_9PROT|nr:N-formylglutamate amidohydrolase [Limimonas halophila]SDG38849.1 Predicted N-formylglutamate amidohydrolase [Limimonas halophila]